MSMSGKDTFFPHEGYWFGNGQMTRRDFLRLATLFTGAALSACAPDISKSSSASTEKKDELTATPSPETAKRVDALVFTREQMTMQKRSFEEGVVRFYDADKHLHSYESGADSGMTFFGGVNIKSEGGVSLDTIALLTRQGGDWYYARKNVQSGGWDILAPYSQKEVLLNDAGNILFPYVLRRDTTTGAYPVDTASSIGPVEDFSVLMEERLKNATIDKFWYHDINSREWYILSQSNGSGKVAALADFAGGDVYKTGVGLMQNSEFNTTYNFVWVDQGNKERLAISEDGSQEKLLYLLNDNREWEAIVEMTVGDKLIWDAMPENMPDIDGSYRVFDRERGFIYKDKDGKVVGLWDYNTYKLGDPNTNFMRKAWIDEESGQLKFIDPRDGKERIKYPEVIKVTLMDDEGNVIDNKFNGIELHTTARNYKLNPKLSREVVGEGGDLAQMMTILEEAYRLKLLPQFADGAMTPAELDGPLPFRENTLWKTIWEIPPKDHAEKRWLGENLLPYTPVVFDPADGSGMRWSPELMKQNDGTVAGWWGITMIGSDSDVELIKGVNASVQSLLDNGVFDVDGGLGGRVSKDQYVRTGRGMILPIRIKDESTFKVLAGDVVDDNLLILFKELQAVKAKQQALYESVLSVGKIPDGCKDGTMPAFADYYRTSAA